MSDLDKQFQTHLERTEHWPSGLNPLLGVLTLLLLVCSPAIVWAVYSAAF